MTSSPVPDAPSPSASGASILWPLRQGTQPGPSGPYSILSGVAFLLHPCLLDPHSVTGHLREAFLELLFREVFPILQTPGA